MRSTSETLRATQLTSVAPSLCKATRVDLAVAPEPKITPSKSVAIPLQPAHRLDQVHRC
jgi:hypothetical protein